MKHSKKEEEKAEVRETYCMHAYFIFRVKEQLIPSATEVLLSAGSGHELSHTQHLGISSGVFQLPGTVFMAQFYLLAPLS